MKNQEIDNKLIEAVENQVYKDPNKNLQEVQVKKKWYTKLYPLINLFIEDELQKYNPKLFRYFQNRGDIYFDEITLKRAVYSDKKGSKEMINLLGYYAFRNEWEARKDDFFSIAEEKDILNTIPEVLTEKTTTIEVPKKNFELKYILMALLFTTIFSIIGYGILNLIQAPLDPSPEDDRRRFMTTCDCNIEPVTTDLELLDSFNFNKIIKLSKDDIPTDEIKHLIQYQDKVVLNPLMLEEESRSFVHKMKNNFPEKYNDTIVPLCNICAN